MKFEVVCLVGNSLNWVSYCDRLGVILCMWHWQEHLTSATVTQAYRDRGNMNRVTPNMCWKDDNEAVKALIMSLIPDELFNQIKSGVNAKAW